jgi:hypothetical protein
MVTVAGLDFPVLRSKQDWDVGHRLALPMHKRQSGGPSIS